MFFKRNSASILKSFIHVIPQLNEIINEDVMTCVTDREKFLIFTPSKSINMPVIVGKPIPSGDPLTETIRSNKIISAIVPKEVYGVAFKAVTFPIRDENGECIGAVGYAKSLEKEFLISNSLNGLIEEITDSNKEMSRIRENVVDISSKIQDNSASIEETLAGSQQMAVNAQVMNSTAKETENLSSEVEKESAKGKESVEEIVSSVKGILESTNNIDYLMQVLNDSAEEIGSIIGLISRISEQINLLALNAAIEAARAGEHGKGFSVVAGEVRKLAEQSKSATMDIVNLVQTMQKNTDNVNSAVQESKSKIMNGENAANSATQNISVISKRIHEVNTKINELVKKCDAQFKMSEQIVVAVGQIAVSVNENAVSANLITEITEDQARRLIHYEDKINEVSKKVIDV